MASFTNHYEVLGLPADAESPAIEYACKKCEQEQDAQHYTSPEESQPNPTNAAPTKEQTQHLPSPQQACPTLLNRWSKSSYDRAHKVHLDAYTAQLTLSRAVAVQKAARAKLFEEAAMRLKEENEAKLAAAKQAVEHLQSVFPPGSGKRREGDIWRVELIPRTGVTTFELQRKQMMEVEVLVKLESAWMSLVGGEREGYVVEDVVKKWDEFVRVRAQREEEVRKAAEGKRVELMEEVVRERSAKGVAEALEAAVGKGDGESLLSGLNGVSVGLVNVVVLTWMMVCLRIWWRTLRDNLRMEMRDDH